MKYIILALMVISVSANSKERINFTSPKVSDELLGSPIWSLAEDSNGFLWIAAHSGIYKYNGIDLLDIPIIINNEKKFGVRVNCVYTDSEKRIWIGTNKYGLFYLKNNSFINLKITTNLQQIKIKSIKEIDSILWVVGNFGLTSIDKNHLTQLKYFPLEDELITQVEILDSNLLLGTEHGLKTFNPSNGKLIKSKYLASINDDYIRVLYKFKDTILVGSSNGLYDIQTEKLIHPILDKHWINSIQYDGEKLWVGTVFNGLYQFDPSFTFYQNFTNDISDPLSINDNAINTLYITQTQHLFIGTFANGLNQLNLNAKNFESYNNFKNSIGCVNSSVFISYLIEKEYWWLGTDHGLVRFNNTNSECLVFEEGSVQAFSNEVIISLDKDKNKLWVSTGSQLNLLDIDSMKIDWLEGKVPKISTNFSHEFSLKERLIGTYRGLYLFDRLEGKSKLIESENGTFNNVEFYNTSKNNKGEFIFATSIGLAKLHTDGKIQRFANQAIPTGKFTTYTLFIDDDDSVWVGVEKEGLYHLGSEGNLISIINKSLNLQKPSFISTIEKDNEGLFWLGTGDGLIRYNPKKNIARKFTKSDGLQNDTFLIYSSFKDKKGNLYFGGRQGFNKFNPNNINLKKKVLTPLITKFSLLNQEVEIEKPSQTGFVLKKPINELDEIEFSYKDYIIGFEFTALDYADSKRIKYAYRLLGFNDDWVNTNASNRQATYTNLSPGSYTFQVKAANKDGVWSEQAKALKIIVHPAPWFSPWAFASYVLLVILSIWGFIRYKTIASRNRAIVLEKTVVLRTHEVNRQKKMVESLLDHKNEIFANVTHEFKTPLALILGPSEHLLNNPELIKYSDEHLMIQRNAKRLMLMVGQILKLSQAENDKEVFRESQGVQAILLMLYESFRPIALEKNIELSLENKNDVNVYATSECLEIVVGNLISNALKFTNSGGKVSICSKIKHGQVSIDVQDTGSGIQEKDFEKIFTRFSRLDVHKNIAGTGIGLSVVKEITQANDGQVTLESTWGKGTLFTLIFPTTDIKADEEMSQVMVDQLVSNTHNELIEETNKTFFTSKKNRVSVLIIEDNHDMQKHIGKVLANRFNCLFTDRGKAGIALALKELPDIVICDVMMPEMDGYQVTRILRHDSRTSHIPIVLLTALNTTESRIKGWRENIDTYMTKPFNSKELHVQLDNILTIRSLLQKKTNQAFKSNKPLDNLGLSKKDIKFIDKLRDVIGKIYTNEYIQKADLADKMAISERHLNRKVKALIDENPMDMLREYRLEKACMKLKEGYQVSIVSDECGFSSVAYFCRVFKKKYGMTAKQYQNLKTKPT